MNRRTICWLMMSPLLGTAAPTAGGAEYSTLKRNPFERVATTLSSDSATPERRAVNEFRRVLVGVLVAGEHSLVDVDGVILRIGEDIDGFTLVDVHEDRAEFRRGSERVVLRLKQN